MKIINPIKINDWDILKFLKIILSLQLAYWGITALNYLGIEIPLIRQILGFIYLTFIPGAVLLRIIKLHKLTNIATILYTIGLSVVSLMYITLFMKS